MIKKSRELVVAVHNEKLGWLKDRKLKFGDKEKISAYCKFETRNDFDFVEHLPNIGRESHTYVHHIIKNYDNLCYFTTFLQGYPMVHYRFDDNPNLEILNYEIEPIHDYNPLGVFVVTDSFGRPFSPRDLNLFPIWEILFKGNMPQQFFVNYGAQFIVSKKVIKNRSLAFWQTLLSMHDDYEYLPWALELMWYHIFDPRFKAAI